MRTCGPADRRTGKLWTKNLRTVTADWWVKCVPIIDVFTGRLVSWKLEYCTGREAGASYSVRAWETAGRYAAATGRPWERQ